MNFSTISSWGLVVWKALESYGCDGGALFKQAGLDPAKLTDPNARYPISAMRRLWTAAVETTGDPCFGLAAAKFWHPTTLHALGYSWLASPTLQEALERTVRYFRLVTTGGELRLETSGGHFRLAFQPHPQVEPVPGTALDAAMAVFVHMCRTSYGEAFRPVRVDLTHEALPCADRMAEFFQAPIRYGASENTLVLGTNELTTPLPTANAELARANDEIIAAYLAELDGSISAQVRARLLSHLPSGTVSEEAIASALHLSLRSLQRKLRAEGTTFAGLLNETRVQLATKYLEDSRVSISEITYLLGFAEVSSFSRAFRRWQGVSPSEYRESRRRASIDQAVPA